MVQTQFVTIHGHRRAYAIGGPPVGEAPVLLLLHGLACDRHTWDSVWDDLAERYTVIAPDLLGHGESDKPRGDYSVGGYANGMRDLLTVLGIDKVTVIGHSFGGGVAMQFGYQFPERTERIFLVDAGGLGREVTPFIRALALPGYDAVLRFLTMPGVLHLNIGMMRALHALVPTPHTRDLAEVAEIMESFKEPGKRRAVHQLVTNAIDWRGQIVSIRDRAYLTEEMPLCVLWGEDDMVIPAKHADVVAELAPAARVVVIPDAGHFPHKDHPAQFVALVDDFMTTTSPAVYSRAKWRRLLKTGRPAPLSSVSDETIKATADLA
ncbi:alpha/beta fold hydrolase [Nocardioides sp. Kera G14]|uniref:alpha/beta fold hydrolase n=1 Tax=Nocardioides sp. Kera G14 TaxID=2884264 RepID=UPI001D107A27|nr:alpha/beta fold hydrolase [Nocardioides sp. Kera G14]UDY24871.1 alpha/beta fold hydrolase [Nocardioides sp. Kera G14]